MASRSVSVLKLYSALRSRRWGTSGPNSRCHEPSSTRACCRPSVTDASRRLEPSPSRHVCPSSDWSRSQGPHREDEHERERGDQKGRVGALWIVVGGRERCDSHSHHLSFTTGR